jgi:hypothetical protein
MFRGKNLEELVQLFVARDVSLYHACQLQDFASYLRFGGIPSRELLEQSRLPFTPFQTDSKDRTNGVWDKVFVNLSDFGKSFATGGTATPNPYGPILLLIHPSALRQAEDVAICLRSAGGRDFNREGESLTSTSEINRLFRWPAQKNRPETSVIKFSDQLREDFPEIEDPYDPEVSCTYPGDILPSAYITRGIVDPYTVGDSPLHVLAARVSSQFGVTFPVGPRFMNAAVSGLYDELGRLLAQEAPNCARLAQHASASVDLREWAGRVYGRGLSWQFDRFASYLRAGTLDGERVS